MKEVEDLSETIQNGVRHPMNAMRFRETIELFDKGYGRVMAGEDRLLRQVKRFEGRLQELANAKAASRISQQHDVAKLANHLKSAITDAITRWTERFADAAPVRRLSEKYGDRAILLVFGKVNSGKSTFVNLLVDELQRAGAGVKGFAIKGGKEIDVAPCFAMGATETTARIQGVEVDDRLVLLDSPGLHSVTEENHERTRLFTDSADAVLWLSPSSSPGQVQELRDLKRELDRKKPLLPVITKSDMRVEDWCEATERITATIRNKAREVRKEQEDDVLSRTRQLGLNAEIRPVISVSVFAYEKACRSDDARIDAGLDILYECLTELVEEANRYKVGKAEQLARNYIDEQVIRTVEERVESPLNDLVALSDRCIHELDGPTRQRLKDDVVADALSKLRCIVEQHKDSRNKQAIADELKAAITGRLAEALDQELTQYVEHSAGAVVPLLELSPNDLADFGDIIIEIKQRKGAVPRSVSSSLGGAGGAAAGMALGTLVFPGVGTAIGGLVGGIVGGLAGGGIGSVFEKEEIISQVVGVSGEPLMTSGSRVLTSRIAAYVDSGIDAVVETVRSTAGFAIEVNAEIDRFKRDVQRE